MFPPILSQLTVNVHSTSIPSSPPPHLYSFSPLFLSFNKLPQTRIDFLLSEGGSASDLFHYHRLIIPIEMRFSSQGVLCCFVPPCSSDLNARTVLYQFPNSPSCFCSTPVSLLPPYPTISSTNNQLVHP